MPRIDPRPPLNFIANFAPNDLSMTRLTEIDMQIFKSYRLEAVGVHSCHKLSMICSLQKITATIIVRIFITQQAF